ncbi:MAG: hypothetical protein QF437_15165, partial [Planctomycetota bacterium]|nr:hypothetical protein [Planctomycetota bacterium]
MLSKPPRIFIDIPDHTIGVVPGQRMPFSLHILDAQPQKACVAIMISDPLGRSRQHISDEFSIDSSDHVHPMLWEQVRRGQPGTYRLQVELFLPETNQRFVVSRHLEMVIPGHLVPGVLRPVERVGPVCCPFPFPDPDTDALEAAFELAHEEVQALANGNGSYGKGYEMLVPNEDEPAAETRENPLVRTTASIAMGYMLAGEVWGNEEYTGFARAALNYLLSHDQHESGAFLYWGMGEEERLNDQDNFYCTGYGALPFVMAHEMLQCPRALDVLKRAGDWTLDKPLTGNVNYDLFAMWFLPQLYRLTGDEKYLDSAIWRTEGAAFDGQNPGGAWPGHNLSHGYHAIILLGMASLYRELPDDHPFRSRLHTRLVMAAHFGAAMFSEEGSSYYGWEYNRRGFHVDWEGRPAGKKTIPYGAWCAAWQVLDDCLELDDHIASGLCHAMCRAHQRYLDGTD